MIASLTIFKRMKVRVYIKSSIKVLNRRRKLELICQEYRRRLGLINRRNKKGIRILLDRHGTRWIRSLMILNLKSNKIRKKGKFNQTSKIIRRLNRKEV